MVSFTILAGGRTAYIASYLFNTVTNSLTYVGQYTAGTNTSWLCLHPANNSVLYATNENTPGAFQSFTIGQGGDLTLVDAVSPGGNHPTYCAVLSTGQVGVPNHNSGTVAFFSTGSDDTHFSDNTDVLTIPVPNDNPLGSEPHMIYEYSGEVFIPDAGTDKIWRVGQVGGSFVIHGEIQQPSRSGPRHIRIRDNMLYVLHEASSTLTLQEVPSYPNGTSPTLSNVSVIPSDAPAGSIFKAAEILIPEPTEEYPVPYIYVSNRNFASDAQDPRGDTIAIFENVDNRLVLRNQVYTGIAQVRGMMSGEQAGRGGEAYIVASGDKGAGGVKVFKRTEGGANLEEVAVNTVVPTRLSFVWLEGEHSDMVDALL